MGNNKNKSKSQPRRVGRPRKAKGKDKPAVDSPVSSPKSRPKPCPTGRSVPSEPDVLSAENESFAILAATEGLLGLSKPGKAHDASGVPSDLEIDDRNGSNTPSDKGRGDTIGLDEEDDDSKSSASDSEEEEEENFELTFVIPVDGASDTTTLESDISWTDFGYRVSDIMGIRVKNLNLAYRFSTTPQKDLPQMLRTPLHLARLFNNARQILDERAAGKSKSKREFRVILVDRNVGKKGRKTTEGKKKQKKKKKPQRDTDSNTNSNSNSDADVAPKKKTGPQFIIELQAEHACGDHIGEYCLIRPNGLITTSQWRISVFGAEGVHSSLKSAPHELKIEDAVRPPRTATHKRSQSETYPPPPPFYYGYPPLPAYPPSYYGPSHGHPSGSATLKRGLDHDIPSFDPFVPEEVPTIYPRIDEWLTELDSGEGGPTRLGSLVDDGPKDLAEMTGMPIGIAKLLIMYAKADADRITKREKRARRKID